MTMPAAESNQERRLVKVLIMKATRYAPEMFRDASNRLTASVPRPEGCRDHTWQLSDNLEDDLTLVLFPSVYEDADRLTAAHNAFRKATGAPVEEHMQTWDMTPPSWARERV